jgi:hypothetical protein
MVEPAWTLEEDWDEEEEDQTWNGDEVLIPPEPAAEVSTPPERSAEGSPPVSADTVVAMIEVRWVSGIRWLSVRQREGVEAAIRRATHLWYEADQPCRVQVLKMIGPMQAVPIVEFRPRQT